MLKVVLKSFFFIILVELALHTVSLLLLTRLLYLYFIWNPKNSLRKRPSGYYVGLLIRSSWLTDDIFFFFPVPGIFLNYIIHDIDIFSILIFHE